MVKASKTVWSRAIPTEPGWYWVKYRHGRSTCLRPCSVVSIAGTEFVSVSDSGYFSSTTRKHFGFTSARFGPRIEVPE